MEITRRGFFGAAVAAGPVSLVGRSRAAAPLATGAAGARPAFKLGMAGCTMHRKSIDETLGILKKTDIHYLCVKDFHLPLAATDAEMAAFREKCVKSGVEPYALGQIYMEDAAFARQAETNVVADAVEEMSPELKAWIAQMDHFIQEAGFKSEVDEKGMFRIRLGFPDERTQCVYVMPGVYEENGYKTIHVHSVAYCGNLTKAMQCNFSRQPILLVSGILSLAKRILGSMRYCSPCSCLRMSNPKTSR